MRTCIMAPTQKQVVEALMTFVRREKKVVNGTEKTSLTFKCPKPTCPVGEITFKEKSGFNNPFTHLRSCYGRGKNVAEQKKLLHELKK